MNGQRQFICAKCGHQFWKIFVLYLVKCPICKSIRVIEIPTI